MTPSLTDETLALAVADLARRDPDLARVVQRFGAPPLWARDPGFGTLVQIILEQQVSLASARAAYERLLHASGDGSPARVAALDDATFRAAGVSRQKTRYIRLLAQAIVDGAFDPAALAAMEDEAARTELMKLKGIGAWSADIYLLMALGRADIWPSGDLAVIAAARELKRLRSSPSAVRLDRIGAAWRPWRAVAARILWHHYLSTPRTRTTVSAAKPPSRRTVAPSRRPAPKGRRSASRSRVPSRARAAGVSSTSTARRLRGGRTRV